MGVFTVIGGAFGLLSYLSGDVAWQAALVLAVVAYTTGLAYGYGAAAGNAGFFLLLWALAVQIGTAEGADPPATAAAFLVGGAVAMVVMAALVGLRLVDVTPAERRGAASKPAPNLGAVATSPVGIWSLVRAVLILIAVLIGYQITRALDPFWVAIVVLVVFLPEADKTVLKAIQRGTGTLTGAVAGTALLALTPSEPVVAAAMLVAAFFAVAFYTANYLIYAFFLTAAIVFYEWFAAGEQLGAGGERLLAAVIGLVLAGIGVWLTELSRPRRVRRRRALARASRSRWRYRLLCAVSSPPDGLDAGRCERRSAAVMAGEGPPTTWSTRSHRGGSIRAGLRPARRPPATPICA